MLKVSLLSITLGNTEFHYQTLDIQRSKLSYSQALAATSKIRSIYQLKLKSNKYKKNNHFVWSDELDHRFKEPSYI